MSDCGISNCTREICTTLYTGSVNRNLSTARYNSCIKAKKIDLNTILGDSDAKPKGKSGILEYSELIQRFSETI